MAKRCPHEGPSFWRPISFLGIESWGSSFSGIGDILNPGERPPGRQILLSVKDISLCISEMLSWSEIYVFMLSWSEMKRRRLLLAVFLKSDCRWPIVVGHFSLKSDCRWTSIVVGRGQNAVFLRIVY